MTWCAFVHTNDKQKLGAILAAHMLRRQSRVPDSFDVRLIEHRDHPFLAAHEGRSYRRGGQQQPWLNDDLQSFTPLRFSPPELMGFKGRALVIDPDVLAIADVAQLFARDMRGRAILCRTHHGMKAVVRGRFASSVMLLDCDRLQHWRTEAQFAELFTGKRDYRRWLGLEDEDPQTIGPLEPEWNDFDRLTEQTRMLHLTRRSTQPWKTGLPVDFLPVEQFPAFPPFGWAMRARRKLFGPHAFLGHYRTHPDPRQESLFFAVLRECLEREVVSDALLRAEMAAGHLRHDAFSRMDQVPTVDAVLGSLQGQGEAHGNAGRTSMIGPQVRFPGDKSGPPPD